MLDHIHSFAAANLGVHPVSKSIGGVSSIHYNTFVTWHQVRAGVGGDEGALFALDLFHMYWKYASAYKWKVEVRFNKHSTDRPTDQDPADVAIPNKLQYLTNLLTCFNRSLRYSCWFAHYETKGIGTVFIVYPGWKDIEAL